MLEWSDKRKEGCMKGRMQERKDAEHDRCRMLRAAEKEGCKK